MYYNNFFRNPASYLGYAALPYVLNRGYDNIDALPEEVKESLEIHKNEFENYDDIHNFLEEQNLRK
ncbi:MAG: hypothetical protein R3Y35_06085 [Clostridia bacterium]